VRVALGDIDGDGTPEIIAGAGPGGAPHVKVFRRGPFDPSTILQTYTEVASFLAFDPGFAGGVYVAAGSFDPSNDPSNAPIDPQFPDCAPGGVPILRRDEIVVAAGPGGGPEVKVFKNRTTGPAANTAIDIDVATPLLSVFAFDPAFSGGVRVAAEDLNNDGVDELIAGAGPGGAPHVVVLRNLSTGTAFGGLDVANPAASFFAFDAGFTGGVYVSAINWNVDSRFDVVVGAGEGGGPQVSIFRNTGTGSGIGLDTATPLVSFLAFDDPTFTGGVRLGPARLFGGVALNLMSGPGGAGFVKTLVSIAALIGPPSTDLSPIEFAIGGGVPFDLSRLGGFVAP
jgi:hypothetical protein